MSFALLQKNEIIKSQYKNPCCRRALIQGIISARADRLSEREFSLTFGEQEHLLFASKLISEFFGKEPEPYKSPLGGRGKSIKLNSPAISKYLTSLSDGAPLFTEKCAACQSAFLRGVFLSSGRVCDPKRQYLLELTPHNVPERFIDYLMECGITVSFNKRKNENVIYVKKSSVIEDFFTLAAMTQAVFSIMNAKIENEIRNDSNRKRNCDTHNIDKAVVASGEQVALIEKMNAQGFLSSLPEDLEATARLRLQNPEMSLNNLARISRPPLSKSGLVHRLNRIVEIGEQLLKK